jgi:hypothetical protein
MKKLLLTSFAALLLSTGFSQRYLTKTGTVFFNAGTGLEEIEGTNKSTVAVFDAITGQMQFSIMINGFEFKSQLMQDHFHENYMETGKFPKSTFKGKITNISKVNFAKDGAYPVNVEGILEIHGIQKEVKTVGTFNVVGENVAANAEFVVVLADYGILIPRVVSDKLSKTATIKVNCFFNKFK